MVDRRTAEPETVGTFPKPVSRTALSYTDRSVVGSSGDHSCTMRMGVSDALKPIVRPREESAGPRILTRDERVVNASSENPFDKYPKPITNRFDALGSHTHGNSWFFKRAIDIGDSINRPETPSFAR